MRYVWIFMYAAVVITILILVLIWSRKKRKRCTVEIEVEVGDYVEIKTEDGLNSYIPVYEYEYNDTRYYTRGNDKAVVSKRAIEELMGQTIKIKINPDKPEEIYEDFYITDYLKTTFDKVVFAALIVITVAAIAFVLYGMLAM